MPSPIIHLEIIFRLARQLRLPLSTELLLGTISPDAIHARPNHTWADKSVTHFYDETDQSYELALNVATLTLENLPTDFTLGYTLHLLTDYLWRENVYTPFFMTYKDKMPRQELHALYYRDMSRIDKHVLINSSWLSEAQRLLLKECQIDASPLLTQDEIQKWCHKVIEKDLQIKDTSLLGKLEVFNEHEMTLFIEQTLQILSTNLEIESLIKCQPHVKS